MADSDSDDELINRLATFGRVVAHHESCAYCATPNATLPCTTCNAAFYCNESCKRRHFKSHKLLCIATREQNEQSDDEEDSSEEESDSEIEEDYSSLRRTSSNAGRRSSGRGSGTIGSVAAPSNGVQIPGLTPKQVKKLLELSAKAEAMTATTSIDKLQQQIQQLMSQRDADLAEKAKHGNSATLQRAGSALSDVKINEIKELQKKLQELERKTQTIEITTRNTMGGAPGSSTIRATKAAVYMPLLVKDDEAFRKYFKLKDMSMPIEQIRAKMEADGVNPSLLDTPDEISPNDTGAPEGAYIPMMVKDDPKFKKYFKLKQMDMPIDQIKLKMEADGVDPNLLDNPGKASPNDPGPPMYADMSGYNDRMSMPAMGFNGLSPTGGDMRMSLPMFPTTPTAAPPYVPLLIKDDEQFKKYFKLRSMGMPEEQIKLKMAAEKLDPTILDRPDDISPNDPGPPSATAGGPSSGPISMEQLFSILMQHQEVISQVSSGRASIGSGGGGARGSLDAGAPPPKVEDQMAKELAAAESALDDIFGDEQQSKGPGGMSMIEQLEKKARKDNNKKLVENHDQIVELIRLVLNEKFASDEAAIKFYVEMSPKLESYGLLLGTDAVQTWSARLLIKNKDTRDWYFSEQERLDAGKAYGRLWSLSFLERDAGQLIAKRAQIINAPVTMRSTVKNKAELIDKFTQLLKDTVKLKHKVFKNATYTSELQRLRDFKIPERFEDRGVELIDSTTTLADAALDLAEEEFRILDSTTRAKKIRAHTVIHVAEKAVQLVGIVKKLGAAGVNTPRLTAVETRAKELRDEYLTGQQEDEDEDDVL